MHGVLLSLESCLRLGLALKGTKGSFKKEADSYDVLHSSLWL